MADPVLVDLLRSDIAEWNLKRRDESRGSTARRIDLSGADLRGTDLTGANLSGADLDGADLEGCRIHDTNLAQVRAHGARLRHIDMYLSAMHGANMRDADLTGAVLKQCALDVADLSGARAGGAVFILCSLRGATFISTDLRGATFDRCQLHHALMLDATLAAATFDLTDLGMARLDGADLRDSELRQSQLIRTTLAEATLDRCTWNGVTVADCDLREVVGLDAVVHEGPSSIGVDTLYRSRGEISRAFLRSAGLTDLFVDYAVESIAAESGPLFKWYSAFLSYSSVDSQRVDAIYDRLVGRAIPCWQDKHQLRPGDDLDRSIDKALRNADRVILFCSEASLTSWWVDREVTRALEREKKTLSSSDAHGLLIPVDLDGYLFRDDCAYHRAADLRARVAVRLDKPDGLEDELARLERALDAQHLPPFRTRFA